MQSSQMFRTFAHQLETSLKKSCCPKFVPLSDPTSAANSLGVDSERASTLRRQFTKHLSHYLVLR